MTLNKIKKRMQYSDEYKKDMLKIVSYFDNGFGSLIKVIQNDSEARKVQ